jgi:hypothetical protein
MLFEVGWKPLITVSIVKIIINTLEKEIIELKEI